MSLNSRLNLPNLRRASSLIRTLLVAGSTLAILLVCYSMYQYSQMSGAGATKPPEATSSRGMPVARGPRLPTSPEEIPPQLAETPPTPAPSPPIQTAGPAGVKNPPVGPGQNITVTIYPREETKARIELAVTDWTPKDGSDHEFILRNPEIRMQTRDGNDVRITAQEGELEAQRKGGGLDPQRGHLRGGVVIEYDRRDEKEKAALPPRQRGIIDPASIVTVEMDEVEFDLERDKLWVPGTIKLTARDAEFIARDLEITFDRATGRVEALRVSRGGRLEILEQPARLGVSMPGMDPAGSKKMTIAEWIRTSLEARMIEAAKASATDSATTAANKRELPTDSRGAPIFSLDDKTEKEDRPGDAVVYHARFEGQVEAQQKAGDTIQSRLEADVLEILRDFSNKDRERVKSPPTTLQQSNAEDQTESSRERIILTWNGPMVLTAATLADGERSRARIKAQGAPARLSFADGQVECGSWTYEPDLGEVTMNGTHDAPVVVRSAQQGSLTGQSVWLKQTNADLDITVTGPGHITGLAENKSDSAGDSETRKGAVDFAGNLHAIGRRVRRTSINFTGAITTSDLRLLDRAYFDGRTSIEIDQSGLEADSFDVTFAERRTGRNQGIKALLGRGNVLLRTGSDLVTCDSLDVAFTDVDGPARPDTAVALGDVRAQQGDRVLRATEKLIVDFERIIQEKPSAIPASHTLASPAGSRIAGRSLGDAVTAKRLRAVGNVTIEDPTQGLELAARELDCSIRAGKEVTTAVLVGSEKEPAHLRLDTFGVTGQRISVDLSNQWAEVPGAGRMVFQSARDLDGRKVREPVPVSVTWTEHMKYRGRENRALFSGNVHAASGGTTTFDCQQLLVEFDDVPVDPAKPSVPQSDGWITGPLARAFDEPKADPLSRAGAGKEVVAIHAAGGMVAQTTELAAGTGELVSRARISGPKMSLNLREEVSKMLIEGAGNLQLEDFRPAADSATKPENRNRGDLFGSVEDSGPSKTLIEWKDLMWYDFSIEQTRFEGQVRLKHLSGRQLEKVFGPSSAGTALVPPGRATFLNCDVLTVDFQERDRRYRESSAPRMGRLSSERLRQFEAVGSVALQDQTEGLALTADRVTYERAPKTLAISGTPHRKAQITTHQPGKVPSQLSVERLFYNLETGEMHLSKTTATGR